MYAKMEAMFASTKAASDAIAEHDRRMAKAFAQFDYTVQDRRRRPNARFDYNVQQGRRHKPNLYNAFVARWCGMNPRRDGGASCARVALCAELTQSTLQRPTRSTGTA